MSDDDVTTIWDEIQAERASQRHKWGGDDHDDQHTTWDWLAIITKHTGAAVDFGEKNRLNIPKYRRQMVRVAALAVAAIEWCDRNFNEDPNA